MAGFTNAAEALLLDAIWSVLGTGGSLWLGLSTTTPTEAGGNVTEPSGNAYTRVEITTANFAAAAGGAPSTKANDDIISFPEASGSWGTPTYLTVHTASTAGSLMAFSALSPSQAIVSGNTVSIPVGNVVFRLGDAADF